MNDRRLGPTPSLLRLLVLRLLVLRLLFRRWALAAFLAVAATIASQPTIAAAQDEEAQEEALRAEGGQAEEEAAAEEAPAEEATAEEAEEAGTEEAGVEEAGAEEARGPGRIEGWAPGAPWENWLAAGVAVGVGAIAIGVGGGIYAYASGRHDLALDPMTTQADAQALGQAANDLATVSTILFIGGGAALGIGAIWCTVLPFGWHPTSSVRASIGPASLSISGEF